MTDDAGRPTTLSLDRIPLVDRDAPAPLDNRGDTRYELVCVGAADRFS